MFEKIHNTEDWKYGEQKLCCVKLLYLSDIGIGENMTPIDIYVRCYVTKINKVFDDEYLVTFANRALGNADQYYAKIYINKNLPALYEMPLLWALADRVIKFEKNGKVNFVMGPDNKPLSTMDLFKKEDCMNRDEFRQLCLKYYCKAE